MTKYELVSHWESRLGRIHTLLRTLNPQSRVSMYYRGQAAAIRKCVGEFEDHKPKRRRKS